MHPKSEQGKLLTVGDNEFDLMRLLFYIRSKDATFLLMGRNDSLNISALNDEVDWVVTLGKVEIIGTTTLIVDKGHYSLYKLER